MVIRLFHYKIYGAGGHNLSIAWQIKKRRIFQREKLESSINNESDQTGTWQKAHIYNWLIWINLESFKQYCTYIMVKYDLLDEIFNVICINILFKNGRTIMVIFSLLVLGSVVYILQGKCYVAVAKSVPMHGPSIRRAKLATMSGML